MNKELIFRISKHEVIIEANTGEIGRLVNFRYPDVMLDCLSVFYKHHRNWLLDE